MRCVLRGLAVVIACGCAPEGAPEAPCLRAEDYFPFDSGQSWFYARVDASPTDGIPTHLRSTVNAYDQKRHVFVPPTNHGYFAYTVSSTWTCDPGDSCADAPARAVTWGVGRPGVAIISWLESIAYFQTDFPVATTCMLHGTTVEGDVRWDGNVGNMGYASDVSEMTLSIDRADCPPSDDCFELGLDWEPPRDLSDPGDVPDRVWVARGVGIVAFEDTLGRWELIEGAE